MRYFGKQWSPAIFLLVVLVVVAAAGCSVTGTPSPTGDVQATMPVVATPTISATPTTESTLKPGVTVVPPAQAPSTPIMVQLTMSKAPQVDEEVEVVLEVQAVEDSPGTTAQIELPPQARLVSGDPYWEGAVQPDSPVRIAVNIVFTQEGEYTVTGRALRPVSADMVWGDADYVYLTVKQDTGFFGFASGGDPEVNTGPVPTVED